MTSLSQPFDPEAFNFNKIRPDEVSKISPVGCITFDNVRLFSTPQSNELCSIKVLTTSRREDAAACTVCRWHIQLVGALTRGVLPPHRSCAM